MYLYLVFGEFYTKCNIMNLKSIVSKLCILFLLALCNISIAQTDTEFWVAAPGLTTQHGNMGGRIKHIVVSTMGNSATVTVSIPANPTFDPIVVTLPPYTTERIDLFEYNNLIENKLPDVVQNKGILVKSTDNISAYLEVLELQNPDIFALKGRHALGTEFYVPMQNKLDNQLYTDPARGSIDIVATENNTTVTITPTVDVSKADGTVYSAGVPFTVVLQRGQTYSVRADSETGAAHPAGTKITSTKPIAVSIKDDSVIAGGWDLIGDQLVPVTVVGSQYIVMRGNLNHPNETVNKEFTYVVPVQDNTQIFANGVLLGTFNAGQQVPVGLTATDNYMVIQSDNFKKFYAFHISGSSNEIAGALLPPTDQCSGNSRIGFSYSYGATGQDLYINIMVQKGAETGFLVDGAVASWLNPASFVTTPDGIWSVARFGPLNATHLAEGPHEIVNTKGLFHMGYINYTGPGALYGYFSDFAVQEIKAVVTKTNQENAVLCYGEAIQLRVDGGFSYNWTATRVGNPTYNVLQHMNATNIYNPLVNSTLPNGDYIFSVSVGGACGEPPVTKTIQIKVIQGPSPQTVSVPLCEEEIGSGCVNLNLLSYENQMTGNWPNTTIVTWQKDVYNQMLLLEDYESERHLSYTGGYINNLTFGVTNPDNTGINTSPFVTRMTTRLSGSQINYISVSPKSGYSFDLSKGDVFTLMAYNQVTQSWAKDKGPRGITMRLKNASDSIEVKVWMTKFDKWEQLTFDFTSFNSNAVYDEIKIIYDVHLYHETDVFYLDDIKKLVDHQLVTIVDPSSTQVCQGAKVYGVQENDIGCQVNSVLTPTISVGNFPVQNLSNVVVCQTGAEVGVATNVNLQTYAPQIIGAPGVAAGNTIIQWKKIFKNQKKILDDFDNAGAIPWSNSITSEQSGTVTFNQNATNPNSNVVNGSAIVGMIPRKDANFLYLTADLTEPIDLSKGYIFTLKVAYNWNQDWQKDGVKTVKLKLTGSGGTVVSPAIDVKSVTNTRYDWKEITFDFSANSTIKNLDRIELTFNTGNWGGVDWYLDDFAVQLQPYKDVFTQVTNATITDGDQFYAIVSDPNGCKVEASISFKVQECGPPAINQSIALCETVAGGGTVAGVNLTLLNSAIMDGLPNTITWYSNSARTTVVANPTNVTVSNGTIYYVRVTDPNNGKTTDATVVYAINALPTITFPAVESVCANAAAFQILNVLPAGGTYSGVGVNASGLFTPSVAGVGTHTITYVCTNANSCSSTKTQTITVKPMPNASLITPQSQTYCGTTGVSLQVTNITGAVYNWKKDGGGIIGSHTLTGQTTGTYEVVIDLNNCTQTITNIAVQGNTLPTYTLSANASVCEGDALPSPTIQLTGTSPWNITYTVQGTPVTTSVTSSPYTIPFSQTVPGTYSIIVTAIADANCTGVATTAKTDITIVDRPDIVFNAIPARCSDGSAINLTPYATPAGGVFSGSGIVGSTFTPSVLLIGDNTITYTAANAGCQSTQNQTATVYALPSVSPVSTTGLDVCVNKTLQLQGTPSGGANTYVSHLWSGQTAGLSSTTIQNPTYTPTTAGNYTLTYRVTDSHTCSAQANISIAVHDLPEITLTPIDALCENASAISLDSKASPSGGVWSGTGIVGTQYSPAGLLAQSPVSVTYTYTDSYSCQNSKSTTIIVNPVPVVSFTLPTQICEYAAPIVLTATATPLGGTGVWSGTGVVGNQFNPSGLSGAINITYTYTLNGCVQSLTKQITVQPRPTITFNLPNKLCNYDTPFTIDVTPAGGNFVTTYPLTGSLFDPSKAIFGQNYTIQYTYQDAVTLCENSSSKSIIVYQTPAPTVTNNGDVIQNVNTTTIPSLEAVGSSLTWYYPTIATQVASNVSVYTPSASVVVDGGTGMGKIGDYNYLVTQTLNSCTSVPATVTLSLVDCPAPKPTVPSIQACVDDIAANKTLTATAVLQPGDEIRWYTTPTTFVAGNTFVSTENVPGDYSYKVVVYDAAHACEGPSETAILHVFTPPTVAISALSNVCENGANLLLQGSPVGGVFSGTGVVGNEFIPTGLNAQSYTITYTVTYGTACVASQTHSIDVNQTPTVTIQAIAPLCSYALPVPVQVDVIPLGGTGVYTTSAGVDISSGIINPQLFSPGTYTVSYAYESLDGCKQTDDAIVVIHAQPTAYFTSPGALCTDAAGIDLSTFALPTGGVFSGQGVVGNTFTPSAALVGSTQLTYIYTDTHSCSDTVSTPIVVNQLPSITFAPISDICIDAADIQLEVQSNKQISSTMITGFGVSNTAGVWQFSPTGAPLVASSPYTIHAEIEDIHGCTAQTDAVITVHYTVPPTITDAAEITQNVSATIIPSIQAAGSTIHVYADNTLLQQLAVGNVYTPLASEVINSVTQKGKAGVYTYYFTQTLNNCESQPTPGTLTLTDCPAPAPGVTHVEICKNEPIPALSVVAASSDIRWYSQTNQLLANSLQYTPPISNPGVYNYYVSQFDIGNNCESPKSLVTITIHDLPTVAIESLSSAFCIDDASVTLQATPTGGTFTRSNGTVLTEFNPIVEGEGAHEITYTYFDAYMCENSISQTVSVFFAPKPIVVDTTIILYAMHDFVYAQGTGTIQWFLPANSQIGTGKSFEHGHNTVGEWDYTVRQILHGCTSEAVTKKLTIIDCGTPTPTVNTSNVEICDYEQMPQFTFGAIASNVKKILVYDSVGAIVKTILPTESYDFTPPTLSAGLYMWTVVQDTGCVSAPASFSLRIHKKPEPTIQIQNSICIDANPVQIAVNPTGGILTGPGLTGTQFNPAIGQGAYNFVYEYTDAYSCKATVSTGTTVVFTQPPVTQDVSSLTVFATPYLEAVGNAIQWYADEALQLPIIQGNIFDTKITGVVDTLFYATQTIQGCESMPSKVRLTLTNCPTPKPQVTGFTVCEYEEIPALLAVGDTLRWYAANSDVVPIFEGDTFVHGKTSAGTYTYYVSQTNICEGPKASVQFTIAPKPVALIQSNDTVCRFANSVQITPIPSGGILQGVGVSGNEFIPDVPAGAYTIRYVYTSAQSCVDTSEKTIWVLETPPPLVPNLTTFTYNLTTTMQATGSNIIWYGNESMQPLLHKGNIYSHNQTQAVVKEYYVTQTVHGCESNPTKARLQVLECGTPKPEVSNDTSICVYQTKPTFTAQGLPGATFHWFSSVTPHVEIIAGSSFSPQVSSVGKHEFFVVQDTGCRGEAAYVTLTIKEARNPFGLPTVSVCEGVQINSLQVLTVKDSVFWYNENPGYPAQIPSIANGISYIPTDTAVGLYTYYAVRKTDECYSNPITLKYSILKKPEKPIIDYLYSCDYENIKTFSLKNYTSGTVMWYDTLNKKVKENSSTFTPSKSQIKLNKIIPFKTVVTENGCVSDTTISLYLLMSRPAEIIIPDMVVCNGQDVKPIKATGTNVSWYAQDGTTVLLKNSSTFMPDTTQGNGTTMYWVSQSNGCSGYKRSFNVTLAPVPKPQIIGDSLFCEYTSEVLYAISHFDSTTIYTWETTGHSINYTKDGDEARRNMYVDWYTQGIDTVFVKAENVWGCKAEAYKKVYIAEYPQANFDYTFPGASVVAEFTNTTIQNPITDGDMSLPLEIESSWDLGYPKHAQSVNQPWEQFDEVVTNSYLYGGYDIQLTATNSFGCKNTVSKSIFVDIVTGIYVPNAFAPTNAAHGVRLFEPKGVNIQSFEIWIYDVWGNLVWYDTWNYDTDEGTALSQWDGMYNGTLLQSNTYIWKIEAYFRDGRKWEGLPTATGNKTMGGVLLLR